MSMFHNRIALVIAAGLATAVAQAGHAGEQRSGGTNSAGLLNSWMVAPWGTHLVEAFASTATVDVHTVTGAYLPAGGATPTRICTSTAPVVTAQAWAVIAWAPITTPGPLLASATGSYATVNPPNTPLGRARAYWDAIDPQYFQSDPGTWDYLAGSTWMDEGFTVGAVVNARSSYSLFVGTDLPGFESLCQVDVSLVGGQDLEVHVSTNPFFELDDAALSAGLRGSMVFDPANQTYSLPSDFHLLDYSIPIGPGEQIALSFNQHGEANLEAVPEPASLVGLGVATFAMLARRNRRRNA